MSKTMIDRVAKAICRSRSCEGMSCCQGPANGGRLTCPVKHDGYTDAARAAIDALREPDEAMLRGAENEAFRIDAGSELYEPKTIDKMMWQAMLDAVLETE